MLLPWGATGILLKRELYCLWRNWINHAHLMLLPGRSYESGSCCAGSMCPGSCLKVYIQIMSIIVARWAWRKSNEVWAEGLINHCSGPELLRPVWGSQLVQEQVINQKVSSWNEHSLKYEHDCPREAIFNEPTHSQSWAEEPTEEWRLESQQHLM